MSLTSGTRLGVYEITAKLGEGGMGAVFRARDTKLDRDVAIKILPEAFAHDADRVARFTREAKTLASLNHPNIAAIYGLEESSGLTALVMELVDGRDLSAIITQAAAPRGGGVAVTPEAERVGARSRAPEGSGTPRGGGAPRNSSLDDTAGSSSRRTFGRGIPLADALPIARQIAEALEAAHEQGIIHRDLKPANIKVRADGTVKVLDFGLAKALAPDGASATADAMNSPTLTARATQAGMILGTAAYMAPEQARGRAVDKRADIWAFGVVLYEMLTGRRAFEGDDISITLASVLKDDVKWEALPDDLPAPLHTLLRRCLERDPKKRLRDIGEARLTLEDPASAVAATREPATAALSSARPVPPLWRRALPLAATALVVSAIAGATFWVLQPAPPAAPIVTRFPIVLSADQAFPPPNLGTIAVSPDGSRIVYVANAQLYLREMGDTEASAISGTRVQPNNPFFSPDGQSVGFYSAQHDQLETVAITGGSPVVVCKIQGRLWGASWAGDTIVFAVPGTGIMRVSATGGDPELVVKTAAGEFADGPRMLDEDRLMFTLARGNNRDRWDQGEVVVQSLTTGERRVVVRGGSGARFVPTGLVSSSRADRGRGHLVYMAGNTLRAVPFDFERLEELGTPVPVVEPVARTRNPGLNSGVAQYDVSATGVLAFVPGNSELAVEPRSLGLVGLDGRVERLDLPPQPYIHPRLSPDGRRLAFVIDDDKTANVWVHDLAAGGAPRRLTFGGRNLFPIWTRDGQFITYQSDREGDFAVFRQLADGSGPAERLTKPEPGDRHEPESWSPDGKSLSINKLARDSTQGVWVFPVDPKGTPLAIPNSTTTAKHSTFSPDGRWIAYMADADGAISVFVQPFPPTGARFQASGAGTRTPAWSADGKRLFFHSNASNQLFSVDVRAEQGLTFSTPVTLPIEGTIHPNQQRNYDVMPDGKRLLVVLPPADVKAGAARESSAQINVTLNWFEDLRARAPAK